MAARHIRIHGDNIIECERSLSLLSDALKVVPRFMADSSTYMPKYLLGDMQVGLLAGHGRWGVDIAEVLAKHGGILRENADSYFTETQGNKETILFALEYCSALPAGNNAWQRNGRALSSALAGVPYLYLAEIGGVELGEERQIKASRFPNPVVPFSYLMVNKRLNGFCLPIYSAHPSITDTLYRKFSDVFGMDECLRMIEALINGNDYSAIANALSKKALKMVELLANGRRAIDTLRGNEWNDLLSSKNSVRWLQANSTELKWKKKTADKVITTSSFDRLFAKVMSNNCVTIGAKDLPICVIPEAKRADFMACLKSLYPSLPITFDKRKPIAIVWITGFKPRGDDSRPDRGLSPLAKMILWNDAQIMAVVYGPAKENTWATFQKSPKELAKENGLWQSVFTMCDYVLVDSSTCKDKFFYKTGAKLTHNDGSAVFEYVKPSIIYLFGT